MEMKKYPKNSRMSLFLFYVFDYDNESKMQTKVPTIGIRAIYASIHQDNHVISIYAMGYLVFSILYLNEIQKKHLSGLLEFHREFPLDQLSG